MSRPVRLDLGRGDVDALVRLVSRFDRAMLVTRRENRLLSRPMVIVHASTDGGLAFFADAASGKLDEVIGDQKVTLDLHDAQTYCSMNGVARVVDDLSRVAELRAMSRRASIPDGASDSSPALLEFVPELVRCWEGSEMRLALDGAGEAGFGERSDRQPGGCPKIAPGRPR